MLTRRAVGPVQGPALTEPRRQSRRLSETAVSFPLGYGTAEIRTVTGRRSDSRLVTTPCSFVSDLKTRITRPPPTSRRWELPTANALAAAVEKVQLAGYTFADPAEAATVPVHIARVADGALAIPIG